MRGEDIAEGVIKSRTEGARTCVQGVCKRHNATADDFIEEARKPVRRSVIAMNRCILYA